MDLTNAPAAARDGERSPHSADPAICIGIDLAWSKRNGTAIVVLDGPRLAAWQAGIRTLEAMAEMVGEWLFPHRPTVVAVDAPLAVPNATGARACDRALSRDWRRYHAGAHPANRQRVMYDGEIRGEALAALLAEHWGFVQQAPVAPGTGVRALCEVYPHPAHVSLFGLGERLRYKPKWPYSVRWAEFARYQALLAILADADPPLRGAAPLLARDVAGLRGRALKEYEDTLDALTCAYVASHCWRHGADGAIVYGSVPAGHILVPRQPAAHQAASAVDGAPSA